MAEALVEFDYEAEQDDELTLHVGDIIKNVSTADGGWWEGELNGKKGMFPDNFVKLRTKETAPKHEEKREAAQRKSVRELANKFKDGVPIQGMPKKKEMKVKKCKVLFDYKPENEDELELQIGTTVEFHKEVEEGWWEGSINGKSGVFPSNFVEMLEDIEIDPCSDGDKGAAPAGGEKDPNVQIRGKKVVGVGLGNIFQGGPIKLRNTTKVPDGSKLRTEDKVSLEANKPKLPESSPPDVAKREKPQERAVVRFSYTAEQPDELSLKEGEIVRILDKHLEDEGWWRGEVHGKIGVFPDNFVELIPQQEEKPKKPPPPSGKSLYPKLPDKAPVTTIMDDKSVSNKKEQAELEAEKSTPTLAAKKTPPPPPVGRKPGFEKPSKPIDAPSKPDPPKATEPLRVDMRNNPIAKDSARPIENNDPSTSEINKKEGDEMLFDVVKSSSQKLVHLTALRDKGPKKRPPSTDAEVDIEEPNLKGLNHEQTEKPPPPTLKEQKPTVHPESDRSKAGNYRIHTPQEQYISAPTRDSRVPLHEISSSVPPPRPPEPIRSSDTLPAAASAHNHLVEELQRELRDLRAHTVSKNDYNDLRSDYLQLKQDFESFKASISKKLRELMMEVDDEKKLRLNTQVEMERIKKLLAEAHV